MLYTISGSAHNLLGTVELHHSYYNVPGIKIIIILFEFFTMRLFERRTI